MNQPSVDNIIEEFNALSPTDRSRAYFSIKEVYEKTSKQIETRSEDSQRLLWKDISFDLLPNRYIQSYQEIWRLESILGSDTVRAALRKHHVLNDELIEELFRQYPYSFYMTQSETYLFSNYGDISESNGGPLKEITPLDALQRYGLEKLEESVEKRYVRVQ